MVSLRHIFRDANLRQSEEADFAIGANFAYELDVEVCVDEQLIFSGRVLRGGECRFAVCNDNVDID